ncbi:segregation and condensation protein B [Enterococcus haemoperoxidus ATCC BAA-382]|uniref:Segregation and condensation protein B n=1 Tax=Enterococcus haemoperoxidus ATCC BAA-382 TaxID=1158608 RepID=R2T0P5_9ENTE|nr:SMC-Scp complex subunit ScpB [Enterococcus haemoperoxidus]EOH98626.1 segregation and condensation protein B [Enterococcus haemoperoxidus ATCC BAA-382]EOT62191.1 segregation and condensation protein B [Enterococcus haemoperoxidus ATCC BAA-382]
MTTVSQIEAILFVVGEEGIGLEELSYLLGLSTAKTYEALTALKERYESDEQTALNILEVGNHFILSTKKNFAPLLKKYAQSPISNSLSQAALETLSIVAYKQPISRVEVDEIRGVQSAGSMQKLVARQLIEEKGRVDGPGRAILYGTTAYFMDYFGLRSLEELPDIHQMEEEIAEELPLDLFFDRYKELNEDPPTTDINESEEEN